MSKQQMMQTARALVAPGKGILAADESFPTIEKRFRSIGLESTKENRRAYREMLFTTPGISEFISGVILFDETLRQKASDGRGFVQLLWELGIVPGIKVDNGTEALALHPGEKVTQGLDGLRQRLKEYYGMGARFAKWRAVITIDEESGVPSRGCIDANAHALARYAACCQEQGLTPIVEPEVLMDGPHGIGRCFEVTEEVLKTVYQQLAHQRVLLSATLLKPNMVLPGTEAAERASVNEVADSTIRSLRDTVPAAVPGIVFLSGGQSPELATAHLNAINHRSRRPWELSFSYGRALQEPALRAWNGQDAAAGQQAFYERARLNSAARKGEYREETEKA
ncbi:MAG: fructose-bisphosphate aldolase class I [Armatimonadetes bacterium]|nr:fructose-bisphosphate aldolase class I [Armatimonadota bacterium]